MPRKARWTVKLMRIITGSARGRRLLSPEGFDVRPTTDKVKESLFNILQFELEGREVLDLFAGSGQLGLEALSRGAKSAVFVDSSPRSLDIVKKNIRLTGMEAQASAVAGDAFSFLAVTDRKFDLVFLDPPYDHKLIDKAAALLPRVLKSTSVVVAESRFSEEVPERIGELAAERTYKYSAIKLTVYRKPAE